MSATVNKQKLEWMAMGKGIEGEIIYDGQKVYRKKEKNVLGTVFSEDLAVAKHIDNRIRRAVM